MFNGMIFFFLFPLTEESKERAYSSPYKFWESTVLPSALELDQPCWITPFLMYGSPRNVPQHPQYFAPLAFSC